MLTLNYTMRTKKNWQYLRINLISVSTFFLHSPKKTKQKLENLLSEMINPKANVDLFKSARSALYALFLQLKNNGFQEILIPYRLCNIVDIAAENAKLKIITYKNNTDFELLLNKKNYTQKKKPALLVATYFDRSIIKKDIVSSYLNKFGDESPVIFDESQSVFDYSVYDFYSKLSNKFLILSFNDKFIPGIMGGALLSEDSINIQQIKLSLKQEFLYFLYLVKNIINFSISNINMDYKGEFSLGKGLRYNTVNNSISFISSLVALNFLYRVKNILFKFKINSKTLLNDKLTNSERTKVYHSFSVDRINSNILPLKGPYLISINETVENAIAESGGIFIINSFKYSFYEK